MVGGSDSQPATPQQKVRRERLRDRIEGTQKEADREVQKISKKLEGLKKQKAELEQKLAAMDGAKKSAAEHFAARMKDIARVKEEKVAAARAKYEQKMKQIAEKFGKRGIDQDMNEVEALLLEAADLLAVLAKESSGLDQVYADIESFLSTI